MTGKELVRKVFPSASDQEAEALLWECTSFPFGSPNKCVPNSKVAQGQAAERHYLKQLRELYKKSNGNINKAFEINYKEIDEAMENGRKRERESNRRKRSTSILNKER